MSRDSYEFAELQSDAVDELRLAEQRLTEQCGEPITLIAYRPGESGADDSPSRNH